MATQVSDRKLYYIVENGDKVYICHWAGIRGFVYIEEQRSIDQIEKDAVKANFDVRYSSCYSGVGRVTIEQLCKKFGYGNWDVKLIVRAIHKDDIPQRH